MSTTMKKKSMSENSFMEKLINFFMHVYFFIFVFLLFMIVTKTALEEMVAPSKKTNYIRIHDFFDTSFTPLRISLSSFATLAQFPLSTMKMSFQFCYILICLKVKSLKENVHADIEKLNWKSGDEKLQKKIKKVLESFNEMENNIFEIFDSFKSLSILSDILRTGIYLTMLKNSDNIFGYVSYTSLMYLRLLIFCFGSDLMIDQVSVIIYDKQNSTKIKTFIVIKLIIQALLRQNLRDKFL